MNKTANKHDSSEVLLEDTAYKVEKKKKIVDLKIIILYFLLISLFLILVFL